MNRQPMRLHVMKKTMFIFALILSFLSFKANASFDEYELVILKVDTANNTILTAGMGEPTKEYRMAYDIKIYMGSGQQGTPANLDMGDNIEVIADRDNAVIKKIFFKSKASDELRKLIYEKFYR